MGGVDEPVIRRVDGGMLESDPAEQEIARKRNHGQRRESRYQQRGALRTIQ